MKAPEREAAYRTNPTRRTTRRETKQVMGYTHYWDIASTDRDAWNNLRTATTRVIAEVEKRGIKLAGWCGVDRPMIDTVIRFNGAEPDDYESFELNPTGDSWTFCKTGQRPYDLAVVATLVLAEHYGCLLATSDGTPEEWADGLALAQMIEPAAKMPAGVEHDESDA